MTLGVIAQPVSVFCQKNSLLSNADKVVVGVSGGADSLCLLHLLKSFSASLKLTLIVAHLNHQLRGADSEADENFVREVARDWGLPIVVERQPVAALARKHKQSLEEAARQIRYAFLWRVASAARAEKIAVGHNADDQVETVLMHFLRGTGLAGLRGMLPMTDIGALRLSYEQSASSLLLSQPSPKLIRPLLGTARVEIDAYCQAHNLTPQEDQSNRNTTFFRNRLRHELISQLETYNPNIRQVLQRTAQVVAADTEILNEHLNKAWRFVVRNESPASIVFDLRDWLSLPLAMKRSTLRRAIHSLHHSLRDVNFEHIESAIEVVEKGSTGTRATLPQGLMLVISYDTFSLFDKDLAGQPEPDIPLLVKDKALSLTLPGITALPYSNWQLRASLLPSGNVLTSQHISQTGRWEAYLDATIVGDQAVLRPRQPGDMFHPLGMQGHSQKVSEFMINEKIPATWRSRIPLLVANNQVLWICGSRPSEEARLRPTTQRIVHLKFERRPR